MQLERKSTERAAAAALAAWALWLTVEYWLFGPNSYVRLHNVADQSLPQLIAIPKNILYGQFASWTPQWASGADRAALPFSADLDVLPFLFLPGWLAYASVTFLQRLVAGFFTYKFLRDRFASSVLVSVYAACAYSFFYQPNQNHGWTGFALYDYLALPGIPFFLWLLSGIHSTYRSKTSHWIAVLGGVCIALSGSIHISLFVAPLIIYWFLFVSPRKEFVFWLDILLFAVVWCGVGIFLHGHQLLLAHDSTRSVYKLESIWFPLPNGIIQGSLAFTREFIASLMVNFMPFVLLCAGLAYSRFRNRRLLALAAAIVFCVAVEISYETIAIALRPRFPLLGALNCARFGLLAPFLITIAGAMALDEVAQRWEVTLHNDARQYRLTLAAAFSLALISVLIWQSWQVKRQTIADMLGGHNYKAYYRNPQLMQLAELTNGRAPFRVVTLSVGDKAQPDFPSGALWAYGFETADGMLNLQPKRYRDFWEEVIAPVMANDASLFHWVHDWGCQLNLFAPLSYKGSGMVPDVERDFRMNLLSLAGVRYIVSPIPIQSAKLTPVSLRTYPEQFSWNDFGRSRKLKAMLSGHYLGNPLYVYENGDVLPRFFLAKQIRVLASKAQVLHAMANSSAEELNRTVFIEQADAAHLPEQPGTGTIHLQKYAADEIGLDVDAATPALMIVTNNYSPYWKAWIDGIPSTIIPADHTFQALQINPGTHHVRLKYDAPLF